MPEQRPQTTRRDYPFGWAYRWTNTFGDPMVTIPADRFDAMGEVVAALDAASSWLVSGDGAAISLLPDEAGKLQDALERLKA